MSTHSPQDEAQAAPHVQSVHSREGDVEQLFREAETPERLEALGLMTATTHAALSWVDPKDGSPGISRIAFGYDEKLGMMALMADIAGHTPALRANNSCAILIGDIGDKGEVMNHPRLMVRAKARFVPKEEAEAADLRIRWLARNPKAKVFIDLDGFHYVQFHPTAVAMNGGFARAFRLKPEDLMPR